MFNFKSQKRKKEINEKLSQMHDVIENFKSGKNEQFTRKPEEILYALDLFAEKARETKKLLTQKYVTQKSIYKKYYDEMLTYANHHLTRIFNIPENAYDSQDITVNNRKYMDEVKRAANFFGETFLKQMLWHTPENPRTIANLNSFSIEDSFSRNVTDQKDLIVKFGKPIPKMNDLYNRNLPYIIKSILSKKYADIIL